jgi:hypothetical protein
MIFSPRIDMNNSALTLTQSGLLAVLLQLHRDADIGFAQGLTQSDLLAVLLQRQHETAIASARRRALAHNFRKLLSLRSSAERVLPIREPVNQPNDRRAN